MTLPTTMLLNRLRYYRYETLALMIVFACLTLFTVWKQHHTVAIESGYIAEATANARPDDNEMRLLYDQSIHDDLEATIRQLFGSDLIAIHKLQRTAGITCGIEANCHQGYTLDDPATYVRLIDGDFPQETAQGEPVQAIINQIIAGRMDYEVGATFLFGADQTSPIAVEIVGIYEPLDFESRIWSGNAILTTGVDTPVGTNFRFDFGFMVTNQTFTNVIEPASQAFQGSIDSWMIQIENVPPTLAQIQQRYETLKSVEQAFLQENLQGDVITRTFLILERIEEALQQINQQLWVLFFMGVLMLSGYGMYIHHTAILHQIEWQRLSEMGFRPRVILRLRIQIISLLAIAGGLGGIIIAMLLWGLPTVSGIVLAIIVVLFSIALIVTAGQATSYDEKTAPTHPFIFDAQLDMLLIVATLILFVRLFIMSSSNIGESIQQLLASPAQIGSQIDPQLAQMPVNFLIPFLLSVGMIMLALRIIWRMLGVETKLNASAVILIALALMVTLTALLLDDRLDQQLQFESRQQTGGTARVLLNTDSEIALPESITNYAELAFIEDRTNSGNVVTLIGLDVPEFVEAFPEYATQFEALLNAPDTPLSGILLSDDAEAISLAVYSDSEDAEIGVSIEMRLLDNQGRAYEVELLPLTEPVPDEFVTYQATLPAIDNSPLRLSGIALDITRPDTENFAHTLYFDTLTLYDADGNAEVIEDFEANRLSDDWLILSGSNPDIVSQMRFSSPAQGSGSLRTTIRMSDTEKQVMIPIAVPSRVNLPAIASSDFISWIKYRSNTTAEIVGSNQQIELNLPLGAVDLSYQVVDAIDNFPIVEDGRYLIMPLQALLFYLNDGKDMTRTYGISELWLAIPDDDIATVRDQLPESILFAEDSYQQAKTSVYPRTMIALLGLLSVLSVALIVIIVIRITPLRILLATLVIGILLGVPGALILANLFPIFSIV